MRSELKPRVAWPRGEQAARGVRDQRANIMASFLAARGAALAAGGGMAALGGCGLSLEDAVLDVVSPLVTIVSPPLRAVQLSLLNSREKRDAEELVRVLVSCGLTYAPRTGPPVASLAESTSKDRESRWRRHDETGEYALSP